MKKKKKNERKRTKFMCLSVGQSKKPPVVVLTGGGKQGKELGEGDGKLNEREEEDV